MEGAPDVDADDIGELGAANCEDDWSIGDFALCTSSDGASPGITSCCACSCHPAFAALL